MSRGLDRCAALLKTLLSPDKQGTYMYTHTHTHNYKYSTIWSCCMAISASMKVQFLLAIFKHIFALH